MFLRPFFFEKFCLQPRVPASSLPSALPLPVSCQPGEEAEADSFASPFTLLLSQRPPPAPATAPRIDHQTGNRYEALPGPAWRTEGRPRTSVHEHPLARPWLRLSRPLGPPAPDSPRGGFYAARLQRCGEGEGEEMPAKTGEMRAAEAAPLAPDASESRSRKHDTPSSPPDVTSPVRSPTDLGRDTPPASACKTTPASYPPSPLPSPRPSRKPTPPLC
ncbi:vegetative cell wall protein gp1-like [Penaeus japonicus]|uniref:vegetative cell wall protein gp1-like n=1 Tax=Penaeus japonicus TaxID=27405 RepID=UPI001C710AAB|nr:vegetative cell wall protein gp1-like [Penaeus japonicus]